METFVVQQQAGLVRRERDGGREYLVFPIVALRSGVLNGEYVPQEEIDRYVEAWNGRPIPIRHPKNEAGEYISANRRNAMEVIGHFWSARYDDGLKGEGWVDMGKLETLGEEGKYIVNALESNTGIDVSSAYWRDLEETQGEIDGIAYNGIARNLRPDHIALLPNEQGACSWKMGCGAPRTNAQQIADESFLSHFVKNVIDSFGGGKKMKDVLVSQLVANERCKLDKTQLDVLDEATLTALTESLAPDETPETPPQVNTQVVIPQELTDFATALKDAGGATVLVKTIRDLQANADRAKSDVVARLVANELCPLSEAELSMFSIDRLTALEDSYLPADYRGRGMAFNTSANNDEWEEYVMPVAAD